MEHHEEVDGKLVRYIASNIRMTNTGVHATVALAAGTTILSEDVINVERLDARTKLSNAAYKYALTREMNGLAKALPASEIQHELMIFGRGLWAEYAKTGIGGWNDGDAEDSEVQFLLNPFIIEGGGTILFAPPGKGKSWTALIMAVCIQWGITTLWPVEAANVLYINLERSQASMTRRLARVNLALGLERTSMLNFMHARGKSLADIMTQAEANVKANKVNLVILDSLSRGGFGDLIQNEAANTAIDALNLLAPTHLSIGHTPRADDDHLYGSQMFDAGADIMVRTRVQEVTDPFYKLGLDLTITKGNDVPFGQPARLAYEFDTRYGISRVRIAQEGEFPELDQRDGVDSAGTPLSIDERILDNLAGHGEQTTAELAHNFNMDPSTIGRHVNRLVTTGAIVFTKKDGRKQYLGLPSARSSE